MAAVCPPRREYVEIMESCKDKKLVRVSLENATLDLYFEDGSSVTIQSRSAQAGVGSRLIVSKWGSNR